MQPKIYTVTTTDQQTLCAKAWGDEKKTPLVLVHGYPDNQEVWESVIEYLINDFISLLMMSVERVCHLFLNGYAITV